MPFYTEEDFNRMPPEEAERIRQRQKVLGEMKMRAAGLNTTVPLGDPGSTPTPAPAPTAAPTETSAPAGKSWTDRLKQQWDGFTGMLDSAGMTPGAGVFRKGVDAARKEQGKEPLDWRAGSPSKPKLAPRTAPTAAPTATPVPEAVPVDNLPRRSTSPISVEPPAPLPPSKKEPRFKGKVMGKAKGRPTVGKEAPKAQGKYVPPSAPKQTPQTANDPTTALPRDPFAKVGQTAGKGEITPTPQGGSPKDRYFVPETSSASRTTASETPGEGAAVAAGILKEELDEASDPANVVDPRKVVQTHADLAGAEATSMQELIRNYHRETDDQRKAAMWDKIVQGLGQIAGGVTTLASKPISGTTYDATFKPTSMYDRETEQGVSKEKQKMGEDAWKRFTDRLLGGSKESIEQARKNQEIPAGKLGATQQITGMTPGTKTTTTEQVGQGSPVPAYPYTTATDMQKLRPKPESQTRPRVVEQLTNQQTNDYYSTFRNNRNTMAAVNRAATADSRDTFAKAMGTSGFLAMSVEQAGKLYDAADQMIRAQGNKNPTPQQVSAMAKNMLDKATSNIPPLGSPGFDAWAQQVKALGAATGINFRIPFERLM